MQTLLRPRRVMTAGSVDDGKSTLIGRLLHDLELIDTDVLEDLKSASRRRGRGDMDLSLITDGLTAEREQGITIDVAHRYFRFGGRSFVLLDSPGHVQYTRNMVCAASQADCALIMVDARRGPLEQTRRHTRVACLLGVPTLVFVVNKLDLVGFSQARFEALSAELQAIVADADATADLPPAGQAAGDPALPGLVPGTDPRRPVPRIVPRIVPVCALDGDNVVRRSPRLAWYDGPTLADLLLADEAGDRGAGAAQAAGAAPVLRFPVQLVLRPTGERAEGAWHDFRGLAGRVASGAVAVGDAVRVAGRSDVARVARIHTLDGDRAQAQAGHSVTIVLDRDVDVSRGDCLVGADEAVAMGQRFEADLCWLSETAARPGQRLLLRQATRAVLARIVSLDAALDPVSGRRDVDTTDGLQMNQIARGIVETAEPILLDAYRDRPALGGVALLEPTRFDTLAAVMIRDAA